MAKISPTTARTVIGLETMPRRYLPSTLDLSMETRQGHYSALRGQGETGQVSAGLKRREAPSLSKIKQLIPRPPLSSHRDRSYAGI